MGLEIFSRSVFISLGRLFHTMLQLARIPFVPRRDNNLPSPSDQKRVHTSWSYSNLYAQAAFESMSLCSQHSVAEWQTCAGADVALHEHPPACQSAAIV